MLDLRDLKAHDLQGLSPDAVAALARRMLQHIEQQAGELQQKDREIECREQEIERRGREIALREARLEKVQLELAHLKRLKFGTKTEAMSADQRCLFEETLAEDEAGLQAQLDAGCASWPSHDPEAPAAPASAPGAARAPASRQAPPRARRNHLPERGLRPPDDAHRRRRQRAAGHHPGRVLRALPHLRQVLAQEPTVTEIIDSGLPASGLLVHTLISRFADHLSYCRQEAIDARAAHSVEYSPWCSCTVPTALTHLG